MYLTEIPELSANCIAYSTVDVWLSTNGMQHFIPSDNKALENDNFVITT